MVETWPMPTKGLEPASDVALTTAAGGDMSDSTMKRQLNEQANQLALFRFGKSVYLSLQCSFRFALSEDDKSS